ncbi:MAG: methyltransferase domain-containing protein [Planctomycetota bacterium]|nr:methyltransferase domain-containing protein [Planctomycetota bacterium]
MTAKKNIPDYLVAYRNAVEQFGGTFDATLWRSREGQSIRFQTFCDFIDFGGMTILDVGCGIGDFAQFLIDRKIRFEHFHGIDAIDEMIVSAKQRKLRNCTFETIDIIEHQESMLGFDWLTFSGTLNAMAEKKAIELINSSFVASNYGVAFNFLSNQYRPTYKDKCNLDSATEDLYPASRFNTTALLEYAFSLTPFVEFTQAYLDGHDATIILRKKK